MRIASYWPANRLSVPNDFVYPEIITDVPQAKVCGFFIHKLKRGALMLLGLGSIETALPYWLCIISTIVCVAYGLKNWNNSGAPDTVNLTDIMQDDTDSSD